MSNKVTFRERITPSVPLTLSIADETGTQELSLLVSFDLNAFVAFEEVTGVNLLTNVEAILTAPSVSILTALLWAGLQEKQDTFAGILGLKAVRNVLTLPQLAPAKKACIEAFFSQLPPEKEKRLRALLAGEPQEPESPLAEPPAANA